MPVVGAKEEEGSPSPHGQSLLCLWTSTGLLQPWHPASEGLPTILNAGFPRVTEEAETGPPSTWGPPRSSSAP